MLISKGFSQLQTIPDDAPMMMYVFIYAALTFSNQIGQMGNKDFTDLITLLILPLYFSALRRHFFFQNYIHWYSKVNLMHHYFCGIKVLKHALETLPPMLLRMNCFVLL
jgi:hypothetical protein